MPLAEEDLQLLLQDEQEEEEQEGFVRGQDRAGTDTGAKVMETLVRAGQQAVLPAYNTVYDAAESLLGGQGVDVERNVITGTNEDGTLDFETKRVREANVRLDEEGQITSDRVNPAFRGVLPTRNYYQLQDDGSFKYVEQNAPIPFFGRPEKVDTGNEGLNTAADFAGTVLELALYALGPKGKPNPNVTQLASKANQPAKYLSKEGLQKLGAIAKKEFIEYGEAGLIQGLVHAQGDIEHQTTASSLAKGIAGLAGVSPEKLEAYLDPITVQPGDPLLKKASLTLADELLFNMPLGSAIGVGAYGLNVIKRSGGDLLGKAAPFAVESAENAKQVLAASLRMLRAKKIAERPPTPPAATTDPQVKVISAAERHIERDRRIEQRRQELGIERPEEAVQDNLPEFKETFDDAMASSAKAEALQELRQVLQESESLLAKQEIASTPGVANQPTAIPELQQPAYEQISQMSRQDLYAAPLALQYKEAGRVTKSGASGSLIDQEAYNPYNAKAMLVWRDVNGEIDAANPGRVYVVDGHNRLDLANRTKYDAPLNVIEIKADTLQEARVIGAISNISDNKGTGIDAAKLLRDADMSEQDLLRRGANTKLARLGVGLRNVPQDIFDKVATGKVSEEIGAAIGRSVLPAQVQRDILSVAMKKRWGLDRVREAVAIGGEATVSTEIDTGVLPGLGLEELTSSDFGNLMNIRIQARSVLKTTVRALGAVTDAKKADVLTEAGNVLDVQQSMAAKEAAIRGERIFNQMAGMSGPLQDLLKKMAGEVAPGRTPAAIVRENKAQLEEILESYIKKTAPERTAQKEAQIAKAEESIADDAAAAAGGKAAATRRKASSDEKRRFLTDTVNKAYATLPQDERNELIDQLMAEYEAKGAIVSNPSPINGPTIQQIPGADLPKPAGSKIIEFDAPRLPQALSKASPNYGRVKLVFESDVDRAIYIANSGKPSKRRTDFRAWLDSLGLSDSEIQSTSLRLKQQLKEALFQNPRAPKQYRVADTGVWREGGQLSGDVVQLPDTGGRIGEALTDRLRLSEEEQMDLKQEIRKIAGDIGVLIHPTIDFKFKPSQAKAYGDKDLTGQEFQIDGMYQPFRGRPHFDLIQLAEAANGSLNSFAKMRVIAFHEAFHRVQRRYLTKKELQLLADARPEISKFVIKNAEKIGAEHVVPYIKFGTFSNTELQAYAFQAMAVNPKMLKTTWAKPLQKLREFATRVGNWLKGRGYKTWNDVYEMAASGEMAATREAINRSAASAKRFDEAQLAVPDLDPEKAAKEFSAKRKEGDERLESGDIDMDSALVNETRRGISRSGRTRYISRDQEQMASSYYALRRALNENMADVTGIPEFRDSEIAQRALEKISRDAGPGEAIEALERHLKAASPESGDHVIAIASVQMLMDRAINATRLHSVQYESTVDPVLKASALQGMVASYDESLQYIRQYRRYLRVAAQILRQAKNKPADKALELQLPPNMALRLNGSAERIESVLTDGFTEKTVTPGLMGDGIYMTTDVSTNMTWGDTQAVGSLTSDIKIMDLYSSNKRIQELLKELELGSPRIKGGGIELSPEQVAGVRDYAIGKGFDGIRYHGDYKPGENPYDEVVVFNKDVADRVVEADVATDPEAAAAGEAIGAGVDTIMQREFVPFKELLDEDLLRKIMDGVDDIETQEVGALISSVARQEPATQHRFAELSEKGGKGSANRDYLFEAYRGAILFSGQTWWRMGMGTAYRALTAPIAEGVGHTVIGATQKLQGKDKQAYLSLRRAGMAPMKLAQYVSNVPNAFRMALTAAKENQTFGRPGYRGGQDFDEAVQGAFEMREAGDGTSIELEGNFSDPSSGNWVTHLNHALAVGLGQGGRISSGIDTFFNYVVGPTENLYRHLDEQLVVAETAHGLTGRAAYDWAWTEAMAKTQKNYVDVHLANGTVVKDGAITGSAVDEVLNFVQFSDKLRLDRANIGERTYERGLAVARESGITEPEAIHQYAVEYMERTPEFFRGVAETLNMPSRAINHLYRQAGLKWLSPIMVTPLNIVKSGVRGLGGGVIVDTWWRDMLSENPATRARAIGEMAVGWGTYVMIQQLFDAGIIEYSGANPMSYERSRNNEILRTPGYSIRINFPMGPTPWINLQPLDGIATALAIAGRVRSNMEYMTDQQMTEMSSGAVLLLASAVQATTIDAWTRDVFGGIDELVTLMDKIQAKEGETGAEVLERANDALGFFLGRRLGSFVPAFLRNLQTDATGMRYQADRSGYVPDSPLGHVNDMLDRMMSQVEVQIPGNDMPVALDPITGFPVAKANTQAEFFGFMEDNPWLRAFMAQLSPGAAFKQVRGADYMPVHTELALLQQHSPKPLVFITRSNLSADINGGVLNLGKFESRGLRLTHTDTMEVIERVTSVRLNGMTVEQALSELISRPAYQDMSPRRSGIKGEEQDSQRLVEIYKVYKRYREAGVRQWLDETPRGAEFLEAHNQRQRDEQEQQLINDLRAQSEAEMAVAYRQFIEDGSAEAPQTPGQGRLAQEVGNFTRAVGIG